MKVVVVFLSDQYWISSTENGKEDIINVQNLPMSNALCSSFSSTNELSELVTFIYDFLSNTLL